LVVGCDYRIEKTTERLRSSLSMDQNMQRSPTNAGLLLFNHFIPPLLSSQPFCRQAFSHPLF
jgi:hypothetical protein